jgi:hypothetical protein
MALRHGETRLRLRSCSRAGSSLSSGTGAQSHRTPVNPPPPTTLNHFTCAFERSSAAAARFQPFAVQSRQVRQYPQNLMNCNRGAVVTLGGLTHAGAVAGVVTDGVFGGAVDVAEGE